MREERPWAVYSVMGSRLDTGPHRRPGGDEAARDSSPVATVGTDTTDGLAWVPTPPGLPVIPLRRPELQFWGFHTESRGRREDLDSCSVPRSHSSSCAFHLGTSYPTGQSTARTSARPPVGHTCPFSPRPDLP